jgi:hypothetical protein
MNYFFPAQVLPNVSLAVLEEFSVNIEHNLIGGVVP